jgi:ribosomal protein S18 acetylase RimI-like enzyme
VQIRPFEMADEEAVLALWGRCDLLRPWNDPHKDIRRKMKVRPDLFLVGVLDGHRGWVYYLAADPDRRRQGLGRAIMAEAERLLRAEGCPKINLQVRTSNLSVIEFYRRIGFVPDEVASLGKRLEPDEPAPG